MGTSVCRRLGGATRVHERRLSAQEERGLSRMERTQKERDDQAVLERRALGRLGLSGHRYTSRYVYSLAKLLSSDHPTIHHRIPNSLVGSLLSLSLCFTLISPVSVFSGLMNRHVGRASLPDRAPRPGPLPALSGHRHDTAGCGTP